MTKMLLTFTLVFFLTLPIFAQSIDTAWVRRYNGPENCDDGAVAMAVDDSGNVYVTGQSYDTVTYYDYVTIKYHPDGDTEWVRRYNGPGNGADYPKAITVDYFGNVYVTGQSYSAWSDYDYATVKYSPAGDSIWVTRYDGPADYDYDCAFAIAVDESGNVYVTGQRGWTSFVGSNPDYATVKYDPDGNQLWVEAYNGSGNDYDLAAALALDRSGNIFVTGYSYDSTTSLDYLTIKYYPDGETAWVRRYSGPGSNWDKATDLAIDNDGNTYVTGYSSTGPNDDYVTIKYAPDGNEVWVKRYSGPSYYDDRATAITVDISHNVYVTGYSGYNWGSYYPYANFVTIKYRPDGDTAWIRTYNGPADSNDQANDIAVDRFGDVYVTGASSGIGTKHDYTTLKYDLNGHSLWEKRYAGSGNGEDNATRIAVDTSGNVYVTGISDGGSTSNDYATIKYIQPIILGDANGDQKITVSDVIYLVNYLFKGGPAPSPFLAGDSNCDGEITVSDVVFLINYLFKGGPAPAC